MPEKCVKDNYFARFDTLSYHRFRDMQGPPGHNVCLKSMSRTITLQILTLAASPLHSNTLMLDSTKRHDKVTPARNLGHGHLVIVCA